MEEFQEADILWPDTAAVSSREGAPSSGMRYELQAASCCSASSSGASLFGPCSRSEEFLSGASSTAGASNDDEEEELMEADVLWPDTAPQPDEQPRWGASGYHGWSRGDLGLAGRLAAAKREGWRPAASSPIDIPAKVAARCR
ncbi:hypothetical protein OsI_03728 [Oryza sativa Indica Group]|uniref:Uncharacterized protein n=1 Tax=Oryza sativa subsp. indica TaxID=39946 RepID=B8A9F0_ORYSI|nr:hypothetical protein OsI_03728 [Oryza sativa Indica Group]